MAGPRLAGASAIWIRRLLGDRPVLTLPAGLITIGLRQSVTRAPLVVEAVARRHRGLRWQQLIIFSSRSVCRPPCLGAAESASWSASSATNGS